MSNRSVREVSDSRRCGRLAWYPMVVTVSVWSPDRLIRATKSRAEELETLPCGRRISSHTLRHSYARHLLVNGIPINYLSRWLGHSSIQTTLVYLELVPDPTGPNGGAIGIGSLGLGLSLTLTSNVRTGGIHS